MRILALVGLAAAAATLTGCGGGGGGGGDFAFSRLEAGATYRLNGQAITVDYQTDGVTGDVSASAAEERSARVEFTLDDVGALLAAALDLDRNGTDDLAFEADDGDTFTDGDATHVLMADYAVALSAAGDRIAVVADPEAMGFEYQSFGIWATGLDTGDGMAGAGAFGQATPASALPGSGEATYLGQSAGLYLDPEGDTYAVFAGFTAMFDFTDQEVTAWTAGSWAIDTETGLSSPMPGLDFFGTGMVSVGGLFGGGGDGTFHADITATGLEGSLDGQLNGPNYQEVGAIFGLTGAAGDYLGAVGGAR